MYCPKCSIGKPWKLMMQRIVGGYVCKTCGYTEMDVPRACSVCHKTFYASPQAPSPPTCDACMMKVMNSFMKAKAARAQNCPPSPSPSQPQVQMVYCSGCGDLLDRDGGLHRCPADHNPILRLVTFDVKETTMTVNVRIWWDPAIQAYRMASAYNKDLVEGFKSQIPISDRSFDPDTKIWTFIEKQLDNVNKVLRLLGIQPTLLTRQQVEAASNSSANAGARRGTAVADLALEFLRLMPYEATLKAYRAAAMQLHPDRGGSMDKMSALNAAWSRLEKEIYNQ